MPPTLSHEIWASMAVSAPSEYQVVIPVTPPAVPVQVPIALAVGHAVPLVPAIDVQPDISAVSSDEVRLSYWLQ